MTNSKWRWLIAAIVVAAAAGTWTSRRAQACLFGSCDAIIIANQITQIAPMVTQIGRMVEQLQSLDGVLDVTTELVTSNDVRMGNIGRLREVTDAGWLIGRHGIGLWTSTSTGGVGAFLQRIPGVTDEAGWRDVLAAPRLGDPLAATVLLGGRPSTETSAAEPSAFRSWAAPAGRRGPTRAATPPARRSTSWEMWPRGRRRGALSGTTSKGRCRRASRRPTCRRCGWPARWSTRSCGSGSARSSERRRS